MPFPRIRVRLAIVAGLGFMVGGSPTQSITTAMGLVRVSSKAGARPITVVMLCVGLPPTMKPRPATIASLTRILGKGMSLIVAGLES